MQWVLAMLRIIHIAGGVFWVGSVVTAVFFIEPAVRDLGATGDRFLAHLIARRRLTDVMAVSSLMAIGAGVALYWIDSAGLSPAWIVSGSGLGYTIGGAAALGALVIAAVVLKPGYERLSRAAPGDGREGDASLRLAGLIQVALLGVAVLAMATARYLG